MPSTDVIQLTLTLKMTTAQVVETSVTVINNSPIQDYVHPEDQTQPTFELTPGFKPFTVRHFFVTIIFLGFWSLCMLHMQYFSDTAHLNHIISETHIMSL